MDNLTPFETRARSRSKTPFLRSSCDQEACVYSGEGHIHEKKKSTIKKSPIIQTIIEDMIEHKTPTYHRTQIVNQTSRLLTSDYSSEEHSPERVKTVDDVNVVTKTQTFSSNYSNSYGTAATSDKQFSSKQSGSVVRTKEVSQNEINSAFEKSHMKTSTPILNVLHKAQFSSSPTNGDLNNHIAYKVYKEAGEYWKKYPKTDYTYSKLSPHRMELAPGVIAMPNMSRPSLEKHQERINYMVQQNPALETYIRKRYETSNYQQQEKFGYNTKKSKEFYYDSEDDIDLDSYRQTQRSTQYSFSLNKQKETLITRMFVSIVTIFYNFLSLFWKSDQHLHYTTINQEKGVLSRIGSYISSGVFSVFRSIYLLISSILYLDIWLLRSSLPDNRNKKRFLLCLLVFLPLLLLSGLHYYINPPEYFPPTSFSELSFPIPEVNLSGYIDPVKMQHLKMSTFEKIDDFKTWFEDYFTYLKTVSQNIFSEAHKIWIENFNY